MTSLSTSAPAFKHVYHGGDDGLWVVVGDKQADAAVVCQPEGVSIYRLSETAFDQSEEPNLSAVEGQEVLIFPKGDASSDHGIFERAAQFGQLCKEEAASAVRFAWISRDLDDYLGDRDPDQCRHRLDQVLRNMTGTKPAKAKPKALSETQQRQRSQLADLEDRALEEGRPVINISDDRLVVLNNLVESLRSGHDRDNLFNLGGRIARTVTDEQGTTTTEIVDEESMLDLLARNAQMVSVAKGGVTPAWPETKTIRALYGRHGDFRTLRGIAPSPIVRGDNTIATAAGYDEDTALLLDLGGEQIDIPDAPSDEKVDEAVNLLLDEWLGDFPFNSQADKANCLGFILTYPMRELVSLVPMTVVSAKSMGTGKSKLVSLIISLFTRTMPELDSLPIHEEEVRKQITTLLATAAPFLFFDESARIGGKSINRLLTAMIWGDRVLGGNTRASLPNRSIPVATGNNVEVLGDTSRRYYPIEMFYDGEHPESRPESDFRHPDIEAWTEENRGRLLNAVFTLIRAWQVAGRPKRATSFGSFERWEAVIGGVLENAGVSGFLSNLSDHRKSADYDEALWVAHCRWLAKVFPEGTFTVRQVVEKLVRQPGQNMRMVDPNAELPPGIEVAPTDAGYPAELGRLYHRRIGGWSGGHRLSKSEKKPGKNQVRWIIEVSPWVIEENIEEDLRSLVESISLSAATLVRDLPWLRGRQAQLEWHRQMRPDLFDSGGAIIYHGEGISCSGHSEESPLIEEIVVGKQISRAKSISDGLPDAAVIHLQTGEDELDELLEQLRDGTVPLTRRSSDPQELAA